MQHYHHLDDINIILVNFKKIFADIEPKFLNECQSADVKKLLQHYIIFGTCEEIINLKTKSKKVIFYRPFEESDTFETIQHAGLKSLNSQMLAIVKNIKRLLPIQTIIFEKEISFHQLKEKLDKKDGETTEIINRILCNMTAINISFEKIKTFARKNGLKFLSRDYFERIRVKQLYF